jgi:hypothetical protein
MNRLLLNNKLLKALFIKLIKYFINLNLELNFKNNYNLLKLYIYDAYIYFKKKKIFILFY